MASTMKTMSTMKTTPKMETCNNVKCIIYYLKYLLMTPHLTGTTQLTPNQKCYLPSKAEIEFNVKKEMYVALNMRTCSEKTRTIFLLAVLSFLLKCILDV